MLLPSKTKILMPDLTVKIDLSRELSPQEIQIFKAEAARHGHSLDEHLRWLLFGNPITCLQPWKPRPYANSFVKKSPAQRPL